MSSIEGVYNYEVEDLESALKLLVEHHGRFPFVQLVEKVFRLAEADAAFAFAESHRPPRVALVP